MGSLYLGMAGRVALTVECATGPWSYLSSLERNCRLLGAKIEIVKMREGWVERYSGCAFLHAYLTHSHMLVMVSSSRVTRALGSRGEAMMEDTEFRCDGKRRNPTAETMGNTQK